MKILVTGGGGFLGQTVCRQLLKAGYEVASFSRSAHPALALLGVDCRRGDLRSREAIFAALDGCDAVIHAASNVRMGGPWQDFYGINVEGTANLIAAMQMRNLRTLLYTSSPSVVFAGEDICGANEDIPYPRRYLAHYPHTKRLAEERVLQASAAGIVDAVSLRPHIIWGTGDPHFLPRLLARSKQGRLRRIGHGRNILDVTHVENAAHAHLLALDALLKSPDRVRGQAYFIGDKATNVWAFADRLLIAAGQPAIQRSVPFSVAYKMAAIYEGVHKGLRLQSEPTLTRFSVLSMARSHYFSHERAKRDFGYRSIVSMDAGIAQIESENNVKH